MILRLYFYVTEARKITYFSHNLKTCKSWLCAVWNPLLKIQQQ